MIVSETSFIYSKQKIDRANYPEVAKIARAWGKIAEAKAHEAQKKADKTQFRQCAEISHSMVEILENPRPPIFPYEIHTCENANGETQGLMKISDGYEEIYIGLIVTNPKNIRSKVNRLESGKMRGVGTYLLKIAEERALEKKKPLILLKPLPSTVPFYLKNGFIWHNDYMGKTIEKTPKKIDPSRCCAIS